MTKQQYLSLALVLLLVALPLISLGTTGDQPALAVVGFGALVVGSAVPLGIRLLHIDRDTCKEKESA
ncbi:MAG: hypothetical protein OHK0046_01630 [Anaerolineae bacterium]